MRATQASFVTEEFSSEAWIMETSLDSTEPPMKRLSPDYRGLHHTRHYIIDTHGEGELEALQSSQKLESTSTVPEQATPHPSPGRRSPSRTANKGAMTDRSHLVNKPTEHPANGSVTVRRSGKDHHRRGNRTLKGGPAVIGYMQRFSDPCGPLEADPAATKEGRVSRDWRARPVFQLNEDSVVRGDASPRVPRFRNFIRGPITVAAPKKVATTTETKPPKPVPPEPGSGNKVERPSWKPLTSLSPEEDPLNTEGHKRGVIGRRDQRHNQQPFTFTQLLSGSEPLLQIAADATEDNEVLVDSLRMGSRAWSPILAPQMEREVASLQQQLFGLQDADRAEIDLTEPMSPEHMQWASALALQQDLTRRSAAVDASHKVEAAQVTVKEEDERCKPDLTLPVNPSETDTPQRSVDKKSESGERAEAKVTGQTEEQVRRITLTPSPPSQQPLRRRQADPISKRQWSETKRTSNQQNQ